MDTAEPTTTLGENPFAGFVENAPIEASPASQAQTNTPSSTPPTPQKHNISLAAADLVTALRNALASTTTLNRERIEFALATVERTPAKQYTVEIPTGTSPDMLPSAVVQNVLEWFDADRATHSRRRLGPKEMAAVVAAFGTAYADAEALELANRLQTGFENARFVISQEQPLTAADITSLRNQLALVKNNDKATISLVPAPMNKGGMSDEQKYALKATLDRTLSERPSWAQLHDALAQEGLVYAVRTNEKAGQAYRGAVIYLVESDGKQTFALKPSDIDYGLPKLERALGPFVDKETLTAQQRSQPQTPKPIGREAVQERLVSEPAAAAQRPPAPAANTTTPTAQTTPPTVEISRNGVHVERAAGTLGSPHTAQRPAGTLGAPSTTKPSDLQREWDERLANADAYERIEYQKVAGASQAERDAALSAATITVLMRRARINISYHPRVALSGDLSHAEHPLYRSAGTRFEFDRFQRNVASLESVPTNTSEFGTAIFLGRTHALPGFYDVGHSYKFTSLTGTSPDAMKLAMMAAERRWGSVTIAGNSAFQKAALTAAVELNIPVSNPELQTEYARLRQAFVDRSVKAAAAFERTLAAAPADQRLTLTALGMPATMVATDALADHAHRTTRDFIVRGQFETAGRSVVVLETTTGKLEVFDATPELLAGRHVETAEKNGIHGASGISVTSGGGQPLDVDQSRAINTNLARTTHGRQNSVPQLLAAEAQVQKKNELWREAGETFVQALTNRHWLGPTVMAGVAAIGNTPVSTHKRPRPYDVTREKPTKNAPKGGERSDRAERTR